MLVIVPFYSDKRIALLLFDILLCTLRLKGGITLMYPFLTLDDNTEIVHSEMRSDGTVKVYIEKPDAKDCFHHATCYLPDYKWEDIFGFSQEEIDKYQEIIESTAHLIMQFSQEGGFDNASGF